MKLFLLNGTENKGKMYYYNGTTWKLGQNKTDTQPGPYLIYITIMA